MFLTGEATMKYESLMTTNPSDENIRTAINEIRKQLPADGSVES